MMTSHLNKISVWQRARGEHAPIMEVITLLNVSGQRLFYVNRIENG
jgi:hypothetical protein